MKLLILIGPKVSKLTNKTRCLGLMGFLWWQHSDLLKLTSHNYISSELKLSYSSYRKLQFVFFTFFLYSTLHIYKPDLKKYISTGYVELINRRLIGAPNCWKIISNWSSQFYSRFVLTTSNYVGKINLFSNKSSLNFFKSNYVVIY